MIKLFIIILYLTIMTVHSILNWNIRGLRTNAEELKQLCHDHNPSIACLQETKLSVNNYNFGLNYNFYGSIPPPGDRAKGGAAIIVKSNIKHNKINLRTNLQVVAIRAFLGKEYTICSIYLDPNSQVNIHQLEELIDQLPAPFLLIGDFNAHNPLWNCTNINNRGQLIERLINTHNISILNNNSPTYHNIYHNTFTTIDLGLCSSVVYTDFEWEVTKDLHGSDHYPILVKTIHPNNINKPPKWNIDKANWPLYQKGFDHLPEFTCFDDHIKAYDELINTITSSANNSIPKSKPPKGRPPVPWWDNKCKNLRKIVRKCYRKYLSSPSQVNKIIYQRAVAKNRKYIKEAKQKSWQEYISGIDSNVPSSKIFNKIRKLTGKYIPSPSPILNINNTLIQDSKEVSDELSKHFSKVSSSNNYTPEFQQIRNRTIISDFTSNNEENYNALFTLEELKHALSNSKNSSPGEDSIRYEMLRFLPEKTQQFLLHTYNKIWETGQLPTSWNSSVIIPILKPNKNSEQPTSYRPIALTSTTCKLFEKMVNARLQFHLEENNCFSKCQYGFRKNLSTVDPLLKITTHIQNAFIRNQHTIGVFFDLEKAYDTTWRAGIINQLIKMKIKGRMVNFLKNFLTNRHLKVRVGNTYSDTKVQEEGVPQGSVLSVTLFLIAINSIVERIGEAEPSVQCSLFADDLAIYYSSADLNVAKQHIQNAVNTATDWTKERGFKFSPTKTVAIHFCKSSQKRRVNVPPNITLNNIPLIYEKSVKFLGVILDSSLTFNEHIKNLKIKVTKSLNILKIVSGHSWGADETSLLKLYNCLCKSKLNYASQIYSSASKTSLKMLDVVHNQALRICTGTFRTSPIESLQVIANEKPLEYTREELSLRFLFKTKSLPNSESYKIIQNTRLHDIYRNKPRASRPFNLRALENTDQTITDLVVMEKTKLSYPPWLGPGFNICPFHIKKGDNTESQIRQQFILHKESHADSKHYYTDGSKLNNGVGCAVASGQYTHRATLNNNSSIFTAEQTAIYLLLKNIIPMARVNKFTIFSDSQSAITSLKKYNPIDPLTIKIKNLIYKLTSENKQISFCWVPAHVNIQGNELADKAAKEAAENPSININSVPFEDIKRTVRTYINKKFNTNWQNLNTNTKLKSIKPHTFKWPTISHPNRLFTKKLNRLRIGHTYLTHNYLMSNPQIPPVCTKCGGPLTVQHILIDCRDLNILRRQHNIPINLSDIIGEEVMLEPLMSFLKDANYFYDI